MSERICIKAHNEVETRELWAHLLLFMKKCPVDFRMWTMTEEPMFPPEEDLICDYIPTDEDRGVQVSNLPLNQPEFEIMSAILHDMLDRLSANDEEYLEVLTAQQNLINATWRAGRLEGMTGNFIAGGN